MQKKQEQRITDFIINGTNLEFNFFKQKSFISPTYSEQEELYDYLMYVAVKNYDFNIKDNCSIAKIPNDFLKDCNSFEEARVAIKKLGEKLKEEIVYNEIFEKEETLQNVFYRVKSNLTWHPIGGGEKFLSSQLVKTDENHTHRVYVPCDSQFLYKFARILIEKTVKSSINFEFKVMNVMENRNGADNIVIYSTKENVNNYIRIINEISIENPEITFCTPHMFGYLVSDYISVAPELGGRNSYSGHIQNELKSVFSEHGRTQVVVNAVLESVDDILSNFGIVEHVENFKKEELNRQQVPKISLPLIEKPQEETPQFNTIDTSATIIKEVLPHITEYKYEIFVSLSPNILDGNFILLQEAIDRGIEEAWIFKDPTDIKNAIKVSLIEKNRNR